MPEEPEENGLADNALITLEDLQVYMRDESEDNEDIFALLINAVSSVFDQYTNRNLKQVAYEEKLFDGNGQVKFFLPDYPIAIGEEDDFIVVLNDVELELDVDYCLYAESGYIKKMSGYWTEGSQNLNITYTAGYATVPMDLQLACMKQIAWEFQQHKNKTWGESTRTYPEAGSISTFREVDLLEDVKMVLNKYRRFTL